MPNYNEAQISERAQQIISANAAKHNVDPASFTSAQREDARNIAIQQLEFETDPRVIALQASQEENRQLKAQNEALRSRGPVAPPSGQAPFNAAQVRGRLGNTFFTLSNNQKISAAGVDPASVNVEELRRLFGRGADCKKALDYSRQNPSDYAKKREIARLLDLYGA